MSATRQQNETKRMRMAAQLAELAAALPPKPKRKAPPGCFKKGDPRRANGRPKGSKNVVTRQMKEAVLAAFEALGGDKFITKLGRSKESANRRAVLNMFGKMIPIEVTGPDGGPLKTESVVNFYLPDNSRGSNGDDKAQT